MASASFKVKSCGILKTRWNTKKTARCESLAAFGGQVPLVDGLTSTVDDFRIQLRDGLVRL